MDNTDNDTEYDSEGNAVAYVAASSDSDNKDDGEQGQGSPQAGPLVDWEDVVHVQPDISQDDISTICYSSVVTGDSGNQGLLFQHAHLDDISSVASSHGTVQEFIDSWTCSMCSVPPSSSVAQVIWSNFVTFRECRFHINGNG